MNNSIKKTYILQKVFFWINIISLAVAALVVFLAKGPDFVTSASTNVSFERYAIILTLAIIPLTLKLFHSYFQKIKDLEQDAFIKKYTMAYYLRIVIFDAVAILNLAGFQLYNSLNAMYLAIIVIFALLFCYPNKKVLESEQASEESENIN